MIKTIKKIGAGIGAFALTLGLGVSNAFAAESAELSELLGSTTPAYLNDNLGTILTWFGVVFGFTLLITIVLGALGRARRQVGGAVGGGRRRR